MSSRPKKENELVDPLQKVSESLTNSQKQASMHSETRAA